MNVRVRGLPRAPPYRSRRCGRRAKAVARDCQRVPCSKTLVFCLFCVLALAGAMPMGPLVCPVDGARLAVVGSRETRTGVQETPGWATRCPSPSSPLGKRLQPSTAHGDAADTITAGAAIGAGGAGGAALGGSTLGAFCTFSATDRSTLTLSCTLSMSECESRKTRLLLLETVVAMSRAASSLRSSMKPGLSRTASPMSLADLASPCARMMVDFFARAATSNAGSGSALRLAGRACRASRAAGEPGGRRGGRRARRARRARRGEARRGEVRRGEARRATGEADEAGSGRGGLRARRAAGEAGEAGEATGVAAQRTSASCCATCLASTAAVYLRLWRCVRPNNRAGKATEPVEATGAGWARVGTPAGGGGSGQQLTPFRRSGE
eukprot:scaffold56452_cov59-Phaeocystis_antarctica.AAC.9